MAIRNDLLKMASDLTSGDRDCEYGDPMVNLSCATDLKKVFHHYQRQSGRTVCDAEVEAIDMVLTKLSRLACGPTAKADTFVDGSCYFAIAGEAFIKNQQGDVPTSTFSFMPGFNDGRIAAPLGDAPLTPDAEAKLRAQAAGSAGHSPGTGFNNGYKPR